MTGILSLGDTLKPVNHCHFELTPRPERLSPAISNILEHGINPRAGGTIHMHGHNIEPIREGIFHKPHISLHLAKPCPDTRLFFSEYLGGASSFI